MLLSIWLACIVKFTAGTGIAAFGTKGTPVPIGVCKAVPIATILVNSFDISFKNLSPKIIGSVAALSPK